MAPPSRTDQGRDGRPAGELAGLTDPWAPLDVLWVVVQTRGRAVVRSSCVDC